MRIDEIDAHQDKYCGEGASGATIVFRFVAHVICWVVTCVRKLVFETENFTDEIGFTSITNLPRQNQCRQIQLGKKQPKLWA